MNWMISNTTRMARRGKWLFRKRHALREFAIRSVKPASVTKREIWIKINETLHNNQP